MPIQIAAPAYLAWALLALPIVALFILRVRLRRQPVSTLLFWDQLMEDRRPRAWWQRLRNLVSLLLQLAFVAMLVAALVDPLWWWQSAAPRRVVLVIDNSASMNARAAPGDPSRLDAARRAATSIVQSLRDRDALALLTAGGQPGVHLGMTGDVRRLQGAVRSVPRTDAPAQLDAALVLARQLVAGEPGGEVILLTDGGEEALAAQEESGREEPGVQVYGVGEAADNVAITAFQVRRSVADALSYQVLVEVTNFGRGRAERRLEVDLEDAPVDVVRLRLGPGESWRRTLDHASVDGGRLVARLVGEDALDGDDTALAVLPRREPVPVVLVSPGSLFLRNVLAAIPGVALSVADAVPSEMPEGAILVLHGEAPETLPPGPVMVIDPAGSTDLWQRGEPIATPLVAGQADDAPLLAHIRLHNVMLPGARQMRFAAEAETLLSSPADEPLYVRLPRAGGDVLVLGAELDEGDLPLRIAFPVMMKNAVEWFLGTKGELQPALAAGGSTVLRVAEPAVEPAIETASDGGNDGRRHARGEPAAGIERGDAVRADTSWVLRSPGGELRPLATRGGSASVGPLHEVGLWLAGPREALAGEAAPDPLDERLVPLAVNLASARESDLRIRQELAPPPGAALAGFGGYSMWVYLVAFAAIGIVAEWFLYQRRVVA